MATKSKVKGRKGKIGKNKHRIAAYYNSGRFHWNKARRIVHHLRRVKWSDQSAGKQLNVMLAAMPLGLSRQFRKEYSYE